MKRVPGVSSCTRSAFPIQGGCGRIGNVPEPGIFKCEDTEQRGGNEEEAMTMNDLPTIMGTVLIVAGLALVGIYTRFRTDGSEKSVQAGAFLIVVGAVLLGLSLFLPHAR